jgi:ribosome biogenesis GTPase
VSVTRINAEEGALDEILPRLNSFDRPAVANLEQLVIVASGAIPVTDPF